MTTINVKRVRKQLGERLWERLWVESPFHPDWALRARELGGSWLADLKIWSFDVRDEQRVREQLLALYGDDGTARGKLVTVRVAIAPQDPMPIGALLDTRTDQLFALGRSIATRLDRDAPVRLGDGVVVIDGGFEASGGSRQHPRLKPLPGTIIEVRDVPERLAREAVAASWEYMIVEEPPRAPTAPAGMVAYVPSAEDLALTRSFAGSSAERLHFLSAAIESALARTASR